MYAHEKPRNTRNHSVTARLEPVTIPVTIPVTPVTKSDDLVMILTTFKPTQRDFEIFNTLSKPRRF